MNVHTHPPKPLCFWQQNVNKSLTSQLNLLNHADPKLFDFIFIQEPHIDFLNLTRANHHWTVIYPMPHHSTPKTMCSVMLVSSKMSKNKWKQIHIQSNDVTAVEVMGNCGPVTFYNVYNACENADTLHRLQEFWTCHHPPHQNNNAGTMVWLGDFNRHYPLWDDLTNTQLLTNANLEAVSVLVDLIGTFNMDMALPAGIHTIETFRTGNLSRPDNIFCSTSLSWSFIECYTKPEF